MEKPVHLCAIKRLVETYFVRDVTDPTKAGIHNQVIESSWSKDQLATLESIALIYQWEVSSACAIRALMEKPCWEVREQR